MTRQGPSDSATIFPVGTIKRGNDGNNWIVIQTKTSKRWSKVNENKLQKTKKTSKTSKISKASNKKKFIQ